MHSKVRNKRVYSNESRNILKASPPGLVGSFTREDPRWRKIWHPLQMRWHRHNLPLATAMCKVALDRSECAEQYSPRDPLRPEGIIPQLGALLVRIFTNEVYLVEIPASYRFHTHALLGGEPFSFHSSRLTSCFANENENIYICLLFNPEWFPLASWVPFDTRSADH